MEIVYRKLSDLVVNPDNPRKSTKEGIKDLARSIKANPDFFEARPILLSDRTGELVIIGGERRSEAARELGLVEVPTILLHGLTEEREKEIMIRDNTHNGIWDEEKLRKWDDSALKGWGVELSNWDDNDISPDNFGDSFSIKSGEKSPFFQVTFTLSNEQTELVKAAIRKVKDSEDYKKAETFGNKNTNGNAISEIVRQWEDARK